MMLALGLTLLPPLAIGYLIARSFLPAYKPAWAGAVLTISLGAGLGVGALSFVFFLARLLAGPSSAATITGELLLVGLSGAACWVTRNRSEVKIPGGTPTSWSWLLPVALLAVASMALALFLDTSAADPYGNWDAWAIWNLRAKLLAQHDASWRNAFSPALNQLAGAGATHGDYPLLLSGYIARCWSLLGSIDDPTVPIAVAGLFSFATVGLIVGGLAVLRGWSAATLGGLVLLGTAAFLLDSPWQFADVPLGFYLLAVLVLFFLVMDSSSMSGLPVLAGLALGCAAWTKDEGLLFALVAGCSFVTSLFLAKKSGLARTLVLLAAGALPTLAIVLYFKIFLAPKGSSWGPLTLSVALHNLADPSRYAKIAKALWDEGLQLGTGIAHPLICVAALVVCLGVPRDRLRQPVVIASFAAVLITFAGYCFMYAVTPYSLDWQLGTSLGRLLVQLVPCTIFLSLAVCRTAEETAVQLPPSSRKKEKRHAAKH
ncbi:MAG: hypothetical protein JWO48_339 [Bryobacterales bacterium]|nr:hypothetical protein [Bryobacterales bacterium]